MKTYQERKKEVTLGKSPEYLAGMEAAEGLLEKRLREILGPYGNMIQVLSQIIDTKKPEKREELMKFLLETPGTLKELNKNFDELINVIRI
ncbi:MAG: hypothetical protein J6I84_03170 [Bacilli bacterium]|nr:hypothetical protein [Bacilli bacterium]